MDQSPTEAECAAYEQNRAADRAARRQRAIDKINGILKPPTESEMRALKERDVSSWGEYIVDLADDNNISRGAAFSLFQMLGEDEAFDGFVTSIEDAQDMGE